MCDCLAWHHPLWRLVGRRAGVKPAVVWAIVAALRDDPALAALAPRDRVGALADGTGEKPTVVMLILGGLQAVGVLGGDGLQAIAGGKRHGDASLSSPGVTASPPPGKPLIGRHSGDAGAAPGGDARRDRKRAFGRARTARWRAKNGAKLAETGALTAGRDAAAREASPGASQASLFLSSEEQPIGSQKKPTARASGDANRTAASLADLRSEFALFISGWPVRLNDEAAWRAYRSARQQASAADIRSGRDRYLAAKPEWQSPRHAAGWLRDRCWRDGLIAAPPQPARQESLHTAAAPSRLGEAGERLARRIGEAEFRSWFGELAVETIEGGVLRLAAPSRFIASWVRDHYSEAILGAWAVRAVDFTVRPAAQPPPPQASGGDPQTSMLLPIRGGGRDAPAAARQAQHRQGERNTG